jgi:hypothetical protein
MSKHYFLCSGGPGAFSKKVSLEMLHQTCVFASRGTNGSRSVFWFVRGVKRDCTIFRARMGPIKI